MNKPHIHCDLIKLWADGAKIEYLSCVDSKWFAAGEPSWNTDIKYRVKPELYEAWVNVYSPQSGRQDYSYPEKHIALANKSSNCIRTVHVREVEE